MISRRITERHHFFAAIFTYKAVIIFRKSFVFHFFLTSSINYTVLERINIISDEMIFYNKTEVGMKRILGIGAIIIICMALGLSLTNEFELIETLIIK